MPRNPYIRSWNVPSSNGGNWKVSERIDGTFACSCPKWKFHPAPKVECHHIAAVRAQPTNLAAAMARALGSAAPCPRMEPAEAAARFPERRPATPAPRCAESRTETDLETALREAKGHAC